MESAKSGSVAEIEKATQALIKAEKALARIQEPKEKAPDHRLSAVIALQGLILLGITMDILLRLMPA
ncbi:hypothetical protein D3C75_1371710 [compost metagenome]